MTELLQQAFEKASKLPDDEQELLAARLLAELADEGEFDRALADSDVLRRLAEAALAEDVAVLTQPLDPDQL